MLVGVPRLQHLAVTPAMTLSSQHLELKMTYSPSLSLFRHTGHNSHTALEVAKKKKAEGGKKELTEGLSLPEYTCAILLLSSPGTSLLYSHHAITV